MLPPSWRRWLRRYSRPVRSRTPHRPRSRPLLLEPLEDRTLLSASIPLSPLTWTSIGPQPVINGETEASLTEPVSGRVTALAATPSDAKTFYVGTAGGGVWKTTDGGVTYTPLTDHVTDSNGNPVPEFMGSVAVDPVNPNIVYAGTGEANGLPFPSFAFDSNDYYYGMGVLKSEDGGQTWQVLNANGAFTRRSIAKIIVDPTNDNIVYAAVVAGQGMVINGLDGNAGIWKSTDGGATWTNTTAAAPNNLTTANPWTDLVMDPQNPQVLFAAVGNAFGSLSNGIYQTADGGATWSLVRNVPGATSGGRIALTISHPAGAVNATLFAAIADSAGSALQAFDASTDGGKTWVQKVNTPNFLGFQGFYDIAIAADPNNPQIVFAAGDTDFNPPSNSNSGVLESTNGGNTWIDLTNGTAVSLEAPHTDHHALVFDADGNVLDGNDGGVWRFSVAGNEWQDLNAGLDTLQFEGVFLNPRNANIVYGGAQDNGTNEFDDSLGWKQIQPGDGGPSRVDATNILGPGRPPTIYQEFFGGFFQRSDNGGSSFIDITPNAGFTNFYATYALDPSVAGRILFGGTDLVESLDYGNDWTTIGSFSAPIDAIAAAPSDLGTIYVSAGGTISVTTNDGGSWSSASLPGLAAGVTVKNLAVDPSDPMFAYAVVANFTGGAGQVFETIDGGATWKNISALASDPSADLPDLPTYSIVIDPTAGDKTSRTIYVGNDAGVYFTQDSGAHWHVYGVGMPNTEVMSLDLNPTLGGPGGILLAGTHGRGAWEVIPQRFAGGITLTPQEGMDPGPQVVAHFIDAAGPTVGPQSSAVIDWGDGSATTSGTITYNPATGLFDVSGDHLYAEEGTSSITVMITDGALNGVVTSIAKVSDPPVRLTAAGNLSGSEGADSGTTVLATFTDPGGAEAPGDYTVSIDWGDGTAAKPDVTPGTVVFNAGTGAFSVTGDHVYVEEGGYPVTVTVAHDAAPPASVTQTFTVADPPVVATGGFTVAATEGQAVHNVLVAQFTDPGGAEALSGYSVTINWGDGTSGAGVLLFPGTPGSTTDAFNVVGTHKYTEEGTYTVTVTVANDGANAQTVTSSAVVADAPLSARGLAFSTPEGSAASGVVVATFTDPGGAEALSDYGATIDWGDGTAPTTGTITFNPTNGVFSVLGNHAYGEEGSSFQVAVRLTHDALPVVTVNSIARVADVPVAVTGGLTLSAVEALDSGRQAVATFTDPGGVEPLSDYSASIDWGDNSTPTAGSITVSGGVFTVTGSHNYTEEGAYTATVTVHHDLAPVALGSSTILVADQPVSATGGFRVTLEEGAASGSQVVATFTDPGGTGALTDYSATIDWGDGSAATAGTIAGPDGNGVFSVLGSHSYGEEGGTFPISVTIGHEASAAQTVAGTATVLDAPVSATGGFTVTGTETADTGPQVVATFTDPGGTEAITDYSATIFWGDGASSPGTLSGPDGRGVFTVTGGHTYAEESPAGAPYTVSVVIDHDTAPSQTAVSAAVIADPPVSATGGVNGNAVEGIDTGPLTLATFTDPVGGEPVSDYGASVSWGDGTTSAGTVSFNAGTGVFTVTAGHTYAEDGRYAVTVAVLHGTAANAQAVDSITVADQSVVGQGGLTFGATRGFLAPSQVVATFTDPAGAEPNDADPGALSAHYAALIDWGDGTAPTAGVITYSGAPGATDGVFTVQGSHLYSTSGNLPIKVTLRHEGAPDVTVTSTAAVGELAVVANGGQVLSAIESVDSGVQPLATFTDPAGAEALGNYSATINWNDGTTSAGTITYAGLPGSKTGVFTVLGDHAFHDGGSPPVTITIHHSFAPDVTVTSATSVTPVLSLVEVFAAPVRRVRRNRWVQTVSILNLTGFPLSGHFVVVLDGLGVAVRHGKLHRTGVRLLNPTGFTPGPLGVLSPFMAASFGPGTLNSATGGVFMLQFRAPSGAHVQYSPRLLEGTNVP